MRAQRVILDDVFDQIRKQQVEVAKLPDDDPCKPVLKEMLALQNELTEKLRDGELDAGEVVKAMHSAIRGAFE
jgi:hypothetical protein